MAIFYKQYQKEQRRGMSVSGYTIYVNEMFCTVCKSLAEASATAVRYAHYNEVEIYPVLKPTEQYIKDKLCQK